MHDADFVATGKQLRRENHFATAGLHALHIFGNILNADKQLDRAVRFLGNLPNPTGNAFSANGLHGAIAERIGRPNIPANNGAVEFRELARLLA